MKKLFLGLLTFGCISTFASDIICETEVFKSGESYSFVGKKVSANSLSFSGAYDMGIVAPDVWVDFVLDTINEHSYVLNVDNRTYAEGSTQLKLLNIDESVKIQINDIFSLVFSCYE